MRNWIAALYCLMFLLNPLASYAYGTENDHDALRELMTKCTTAMNESNFEQLRPYLDEQFSIITIDNSKFDSLDKFTAYWEKIFNGDKAILTKLTIKPEADDKTYFVSDDAGVVQGTAEETYHFTDGDVRSMKSRWTALVHKENGQWKLMKIHFSGNILDNPVLDALKAQTFKVAMIGAAVGIVLGMILMTFMRRKKA